MGFSRQGYWSGLPCPPPGELPHLGIEPASLKPPASVGSVFTTSATWKRHQTASRRRLPLTWDHRVAATRAQKVANGPPPCTSPSRASGGCEGHRRACVSEQSCKASPGAQHSCRTSSIVSELWIIYRTGTHGLHIPKEKNPGQASGLVHTALGTQEHELSEIAAVVSEACRLPTFSEVQVLLTGRPRPRPPGSLSKSAQHCPPSRVEVRAEL